jgi:UDP-N-acetylmuramate--alanine ligase
MSSIHDTSFWKNFKNDLAVKLKIAPNSTIHFSGIGGIGMSGLAKILHQIGFSVQGSDLVVNDSIRRLKEQGVLVFINHSTKHINKNVDLLVKTSAVKDTNPEVQTALKLGTKIISRGEMLAAILFNSSAFCVAGMHGKTTTTALLANVMENVGIEPTIINGGIILKYGTNAKLGKATNTTNANIKSNANIHVEVNHVIEPHQHMCVVETDESDGSFLLLQPYVGIVTNIDAEHLSHYGGFEQLQEAFIKFMKNVKSNGVVVANTGDLFVVEVLKKCEVSKLSAKLFTYELLDSYTKTSSNCNNESEKFAAQSVSNAFALGSMTHIIAQNVYFKDGLMQYDLTIYKNSRNNPHTEVVENMQTTTTTNNSAINAIHPTEINTINIKNIRLKACGMYNVENSLAVITTAVFANWNIQNVMQGLSEFCGVQHRFCIVGNFDNAVVIDDYAHHPKEIVAVFRAAKLLSDGGRIIAVIQPHRYSRLADLMDEFVQALQFFDIIVILDVYSASELPILGVNSAILHEKVRIKNRNTYYLPNTNNQKMPDITAIQNLLQKQNVKSNDIILCLGAGSISKIATMLCEN